MIDQRADVFFLGPWCEFSQLLLGVRNPAAEDDFVCRPACPAGRRWNRKRGHGNGRHWNWLPGAGHRHLRAGRVVAQDVDDDRSSGFPLGNVIYRGWRLELRRHRHGHLALGLLAAVVCHFVGRSHDPGKAGDRREVDVPANRVDRPDAHVGNAELLSIGGNLTAGGCRNQNDALRIDGTVRVDIVRQHRDGHRLAFDDAHDIVLDDGSLVDLENGQRNFRRCSTARCIRDPVGDRRHRTMEARCRRELQFARASLDRPGPLRRHDQLLAFFEDRRSWRSGDKHERFGKETGWRLLLRTGSARPRCTARTVHRRVGRLECAPAKRGIIGSRINAVGWQAFLTLQLDQFQPSPRTEILRLPTEPHADLHLLHRRSMRAKAQTAQIPVDEFILVRRR